MSSDWRSTRPEPPRAAVAEGSDDTPDAWLVTFSDLVLQLFAFAMIAAASGRPAPTPPPPVRTVAATPARPPATVRHHPRAPVGPPIVTRDIVAEAFGDLGTLPARPAPPARVAVPRAVAADAVAVHDADRAAAPAVVATPAVAEPPAPAPPVAVAPAAATPAAPPPVAAEPPGATPAAVAPAAPPPVTPPAGTDRLADVGRQLERFLAATGQADGVTVTVRASDVTLTLSDRIAFASGSADLLPTAQPILAEIRTVAAAMPDFDVDVAGHTDDVPIHTAAFPSNLELSLARAARVTRELTHDAPDLAARVFAAGYGEHRPAASNDDPEGRAHNRRVDIRLVERSAAAAPLP
jgi:chemotaxis protein MotB